MLKRFRSVRGVKAASLEELSEVLPKNAAEAVYQHFQTEKTPGV